MQYARSDKLLHDGLAIIGQYDPALYARMQRDDVSIATDYDAAFPDKRDGFLGFLDYAQAMSSFGATTQAGMTESGDAEIFINASDVAEWADANDVPRAMFAADVIAHEYRHTHQTGGGLPSNEPPAFQAGSAFATKLPEPYGSRIKALSDATLATYGD